MHVNHLEKHKYPAHIKLFVLSLSLLFLYVTSVFFWTEFAQRRKLKNRIDMAERYFINNDYFAAMCQYIILLKEYESFYQARKRIIQSYFCIEQD
jgi:hypothetical protein